MRVLAAAIVALAAVPLCPPAEAAGRPRGTSLPVHTVSATITGRWRGSGSGLSLVLALVQTGDSVRGEGTYSAVPGAAGCGGETLPDSGRVTLAGTLADAQLRAHLRFAGGWGPPLIASLVHPDTLRGRFMAVDRPGCALTLVRIH